MESVGLHSTHNDARAYVSLRRLADNFKDGLWVVKWAGRGSQPQWLNAGSTTLFGLADPLAAGDLHEHIPTWSRCHWALYEAHHAAALVLLLEEHFPGIHTYRLY